jgi:glycine cleavage system pyridoxal-binding protein P
VTHPFLALTDADREAMLETIGVSSIDELFREIDRWIADGMFRPKRLKMAKPAALAMAEASAIPLE